jgi:hypothetical protein
MVLSADPAHGLTAQSFALVQVATFVMAAVLSCVFSRGRHFSWVVFL